MLHEHKYKRYVRRRALTRYPTDRLLLLSVLILIGVGCFFIFDFTAVSTVVPGKSYYLIRQAMFAVLGLFCIWVVSRIDYHHLASLTAPLWAVVIVFYIFAFAADILDFVQWRVPHLVIGTLSIHVGQVTEFAALLILAHLLTRINSGIPGKLFYFVCALFIFALAATSYSISASLVLLTVFCTLYFLIDRWALLMYGSILVAAFIFFLHVQDMYQIRISTWLGPFLGAQGTGSAAVQSIYAIADGGILGVGVGNGTMRYAVEEAHKAFMLPAIAQEIGLIGVFAILLVYFFFLVRAFIIAAKAVDKFGFYLAAAIMTYYSVHLTFALLNAVNVTPWSGDLTLPFLRYGGSSLMLDCTLVGILLSIGRYQVESAQR